MSKKASKKGKTKQIVHAEDLEPWIEELKSLFVNDEQWECNVTLLMDTNYLNMCYVSSFNDMFITGKNSRPHIRVISNLSLALNTLENSYNFGNKKDATESAYVKLCNESLKYCAIDGFTLDTPAPILASLIKYHLFELKKQTCAETLILQEYEQKKKRVQEESLTQLENLVKRVPPSKKDKVKSSPKKATKSGAKSAVEKFTNLRKRSEEFFDHAIIHDEGCDGPQLYVILSGFRQPDLPLELLKLQIPLLAIIKLHDLIDDTGTTICEEANKFLTSALSLVSQRTKVRQRRYSNAQEEFYLYNQSIKVFWDRLKMILYNRDNVLLFKNTMFLQFYPHLRSVNVLNENHFKLSCELNCKTCGSELQESIYEQICFLQYDIQDLRRQHKNYGNHLKIQDVEEKNKFSINDMQFYLSIVDSVPSEMINIPFILDAILLQVEFSSKIEPTAERNSSFVPENDIRFSEQVVGKKSKLCSHLKLLDEMYDLYIHKEILPVKLIHEPVVLVEGDEIGRKSYWWEQKNSVKEISCKMLSCFWDNIFRKHLPFYDDIFHSNIKDNDNNLFELLKNTGDLTFLEKLSNLPCNHHKIFFEDKVHVFCTDNCDEEKPAPLKRDPCVGASKRALKRHHYSDPSEGHFMGQKFDDHGYCFEEMTSDILLQNLFKCFESFNCFDLQQDYFQDKIYLKFHNRKTCFEKEYFIGTLRTPTALRDFYDYTVDEEFYWLNEKELLYIESKEKVEKDLLNYELERLRRLEYKKLLRTQKMCSDSNFLSAGSLKSKNQSERFSIASQDSLKSLEIVEKNSVTQTLEAFDIDLPNRVQFSERRQQIILSNQSKLLIRKLSRLYVDDSLSLQISIFGHTLYLFGPFSKRSDFHFHVLHEDGLVFYFKKNLDNLEPPKHQSMDYGIFQSSKRNKFFGGKFFKAEKKIKPIEEILKHIKYHLSLSLPNSLHLEVVSPQQGSLYVKQHYLSKTFLSPEIRYEEFRCSLLDGKLVKFMNDDSVVIYYPDGTIYYCKKIVFQSKDVEDVLSIITNLSAEELTSNINKVSSKNKNGNKKEKINNEDINAEFSKPKHKLRNSFITIVDSYECILTDGRRILVDGEKRVELEPLFCKSYTDILKGVNITERDDGTTLIHTFQGKLIVNFPDGTRITTFPKFAKEEVLIDLTENTEINTNSEVSSESNTNDSHSIRSIFLCEGFVSIEVHHIIEHPNFATISVDCLAENLTIDLPVNVHIFLSPQGFYKMNFENKAEILVQGDELMFRELSRQCLPEFNIFLNNFCEETVVTHNRYSSPHEPSEENFRPALSCMDFLGNILEVDSKGDVYLEGSNPMKSVCKCAMVQKERYFIVNNQFNGLEILHPITLDVWVNEAKNSKNHVYHHYSTTDHHVLLLLKPVMQNEYEKWLKIFQKIMFFRRFTLPSTYNVKGSWFNPFPKTKIFINKVKIPKPKAFTVSVINRVNCNIHLQRKCFLKNKTEADSLRINKYADMCVKLYEQGSVNFLKANKTFMDFSNSKIFGRILSRTRKRVISRLERRKRKEYELILRKHILLPYFESSQGVVHELILKIIDSVIEESLVIEEGSTLEKLLKLPLHRLTDADLDFIHDKIAEFTTGNICSCLKNRMACKLRILLLAGRILHRLFSNMISVFYLYAENMKRRKLADDERRKIETSLLNELLMRPLHLLTENDFQIVHDKLKSLPYCTCSKSPEKCKLKVFLLASAVLNDFFPNLDSVLKSPAFNVAV